MALDFTVIETTLTALWDFGWFDLTRFQVGGPPHVRQECAHILGEFLRSPISQRSFCSPGPWGQSTQRHGPFVHAKLGLEWIRSIPEEDLGEAIRVALEDPEFTEPPDVGQRQPIEAWADALRSRGDDVFTLDAPDTSDVRVDWSWTWLIYREFLSVSPDREELWVAVIGYD